MALLFIGSAVATQRTFRKKIESTWEQNKKRFILLRRIYILTICFQEVRESAELSPKGLNEAAGIESLLREIELFSAVPDIVWALWCIHRAVYSGMLTISF